MPDGMARQTGGVAKRLIAHVLGVGPQPALAQDLLAELRRDEIERQALAIARERPIRLMVVALLAVLFLLYLPWYVVLPCGLGVLLADSLEIASRKLALRYLIRPQFCTAAVITSFVAELCFCLPASLIWHSEDPFTKGMSVGVFSAAMMRLATIRSIRPATGFAGLAALAVLIAVSNTAYWLNVGSPLGLGLTSVIAVVSLGYVSAAILQNYRQQRQAAISAHAALRASEAKTRFLAQMSHELRTPLNAIIGTGTAAFLSTQEAAVKEQLAVLLTSAQGLALVLNDVLDLSAIEEGHIQLLPRVADVVDEVGQSVALYQPGAEAAGFSLTLQVQPQMPRTLSLDFDRLRQCLSNLLSNALNHTQRGGVDVRLSYEPDGWLVLEVQDTGSGVPVGEEERIFQRYVRASTQQAGHGLGLSICRMLVDRMGGQIRVLPSDQGARFQIRVPAEGAVTPVVPMAPLQNLAGTRVLVVDDIATNRLVAATYLQLLECKPLEADGGSAALALLDNVDVVLLDINMPDMSGLETLAKIRSIAGRVGRLPVVAMTADAQDHDRAKYLAAGLDGYVTKPVHLKALRAELVRVSAGR